MCGILFEYNKNFINIPNFKKSLKSINHRGPDDVGVEVIKNVALGSNRLAIQDLSPKGHMPMCDILKRYWIVYNGEIYNFKEVKKDLTEFKFKSQSDTEVILYSFIKWGTDCLKKFRGMFAFVIYDKKENSVFMARDRFGQKPLLYHYTGDKLLIASEAKQILKIYPNLAKFDDDVLSDLLSYRYLLGKQTGFKEIKSIPPASYAYFKLGGRLKINYYWDFEQVKLVNRTEEETLAIVENELIESVKYRLISDVPVGIFLSGGLDSSLITAIASQYYPKKLSTFSVGYSKRDKESELEYSKQVSNKYQTDHTEILVDLDKKNLPDEINTLFKYLDRPVADPAIFPSLIMSKSIPNNIKVILNGDGGDELFGGYSKVFDLIKIHNYFKIPKIIRKINYAILNLYSKRYGFILQGLLTSQEEAYLYRIGCFHPQISNNYYIDKNSILKKQYLTDSSDYLVKLFGNTKNLFKMAEIYDVKSYMPNDTLPKIDFATMGASLEARSPFLDHKLAEIAFSIDYNLKYKNNITKYLIKKISEKYLSQNIIYRKKQGFSVPFERWFRNDLYDYVYSLLVAPNNFISNYLNTSKVKQLLIDHKGGVDYSNHIWILLTLENWGQKYINAKN